MPRCSLRLVVCFLALSIIAPLSAQITLDPAAPKLPPSITLMPDVRSLVEKYFGNTSVHMPPPIIAGICSVPLVEAPIGNPEQFAARFFKPGKTESMPQAVLPAPPCK